MTYAFPDAFAAMSYAALFCAGALCAMRRPAYAIALLVAVQPFALYGNVWFATLSLSKAALLGVLLGLGTKRNAFAALSAPVPRGIAIAGCLVLAATLLSFVHASYPAGAAHETLKTAEYILLFIAVVCAYKLDPDPTLVANTCAAVATLVALAALSQEFIGATSGLRINGYELTRIAGPLEGPNQLAGYFDVAMPLMFVLAVVRRSLLLDLALAAIVLADVLTFSRGGLVGAAAGSVAILFTYRARAARAAGFMAGGLAAGMLVAGVLAHSATAIFRIWDDPTTSGGVSTRTNLWRAAIDLWRQHPIFGIGAGNFEREVGKMVPGVHTHANSLYLQSLVEGGVPLFAATVWLTFVSIAAFARDRLRSPFVLAAFAASIALGLHQVVDLLTFYPKIGGWWWIVMGLGAACV